MKKKLNFGLVWLAIFCASGCAQNNSVIDPIQEDITDNNDLDKIDFVYDKTHHRKEKGAEIILAKEEHKFSAWEDVDDDSISRKCEICGYEESHKHTFKSEYSYDENTHYYESNCEHELKKSSESHSFNKKIVFTDNVFKERFTCNVCGYHYDEMLEIEKDLNFETLDNGDGTLKVTGLALKKDSLVIVPETIDGKKVSVLDLRVKNEANLSDLYIFVPSSINSINTIYFNGAVHLLYEGSLEEFINNRASNLINNYVVSLYLKNDENEFAKQETLILPKGVKTIGAQKLAQFDFKKVILNNDLEKIEKEAFGFCSALKEVVFGTGELEIEEKAFWGDHLDHLDIPSNVKVTGSYAFGANMYLIEANVAEGASLNKNSFYGCMRLAKLINKSASELTKYSPYELRDENDPNNFIIEKDGNYFIRRDNKFIYIKYDSEESVLRLPSSFNYGEKEITSYEIETNAFYQPALSSLSKEMLTEDIYRFLGYSFPTTFYIPSSVTKLDGALFERAFGLKEVYLDMTEAHFSEIGGAKRPEYVEFHFQKN